MKLTEIINRVLATPNAAFFYTPPIYGNSYSYLFQKPKEIVLIKSLRNLSEKLKRIDELIKQGYIGYSLINYEAGYLFEKSLNKYLPKNENLIQFFFYNSNDAQRIKSSNIEFAFQKIYTIRDFRLNTSKHEYFESINRIKSYIAEGDTYQVNYTVNSTFNFNGDCEGLISNLIFNQSARFTAVINNHHNLIISLSPELFFEIDGKKIISKPMKGTIKRGINIQDDVKKRELLQYSAKNKAENVMIVDMIRNDLGRISQFGSVNVKDLFEVEKYESVFQMISTVKSKLNKNVNLSHVLSNIFPCGSITGAPKIRTMEIINELEKEPRGIYTGSIGLINNKKITFNVAIRTLILNKKTGAGKIGLGSGVVWKSNAQQEYSETKLKGRFLTQPLNNFEIIEKMLVKNRKISLLEFHLERMRETANYFLFVFDENKIRKLIDSILIGSFINEFVLRMTINKSGKINYSVSDKTKITDNVKVIVSSEKIDSKNRFQYFKTTNRKLYNEQHKKYSQLGYFDVIFLNDKNEVAEGAITNIFIKKNSKYFTPPVSAGILPGVYRSKLLNSIKNVFEIKLTLKDLLTADEIFLTNAVRGKIKVDLLYLDDKEILRF